MDPDRSSSSSSPDFEPDWSVSSPSVLDRIGGLLDAATPRTGATRVLAIDGPSGSGKTSLAAGLAAALAAPVVALEDLYPGWDGLAAAIPRVQDGVLVPLAQGRPGRYRRWDWAHDRDGDPVDVPVTDRLILEGAGAGSRALAPHVSVLVWVDAPEAVRYERAMARDGETYRSHWTRWAGQEQAYFAADDPRSRADLVFDT